MDYCNFGKDSNLYMYSGANHFHLYLDKPFGESYYYKFNDIASCFSFLLGLNNLGYKIPKLVLNSLKLAYKK